VRWVCRRTSRIAVGNLVSQTRSRDSESPVVPQLKYWIIFAPSLLSEAFKFPPGEG
jgi:hypothetical protein